MNIIIFTQNYPKSYNEAIISGMVKNPFYLSLALKKLGNNITIITSGDKRGKWNFEGIDVHCIGGGILKGVFYAWVMEFKMFLHFLFLCKTIKFDVVRIHQLDMLGIIFLKKIGFVKSPIIYTAHGTSVPELNASIQGNLMHYFFLRINGRVQRFCDKIAWKGADMVITTSTFQIKEMKEIYKIPENTIICIYNGVDNNHYFPNREQRNRLRQELRLSDEMPVVLYVGRIARKKGIHFLINNMKEVLAKIPDAKFILVVGNIGRQLDYRREIIRLLKQENLLNYVIIKENVSEKELPSYYNSADICVFPSIGYESIPTVIYEAMACGKPIITQGNWGITEVLNNVLLTEKEISSNILSQKIVEVLDNVGLRHKLEVDALQKIHSFYWSEIAQKHIDLYEKIILNRYEQ